MLLCKAKNLAQELGFIFSAPATHSNYVVSLQILKTPDLLDYIIVTSSLKFVVIDSGVSMIFPLLFICTQLQRSTQTIICCGLNPGT